MDPEGAWTWKKPLGCVLTEEQLLSRHLEDGGRGGDRQKKSSQ